MKWLGRAAAFLAGLALLAVAVVAGLHRSFIYPFAQTPFDLPGFETVQVPVAGQPDLPVQVALAADPAAPVMIYFMGNVGALQIFERPLTQMRDAGFTVVAMPYRGGGGLPGDPTESQLVADALALFDWVKANTTGPIVLRGYSLGTGLAIAVAAERVADAVILTAPYTRICTLIADRIVLPACLMPGVDHWDSLGRARAVAEPVLILHGTADPLIPFAMGEALAAALRDTGAQVTFVPIMDGDHSTLDLDPAYDVAVAAFVADLQ
jgi:uncharacterized protein